MALSDYIVTGSAVKPPRILVYGIEGIGKTSFGAAAPAPVILDVEDGCDFIAGDIARLPVGSLADALGRLDDLLNEEHPFQTVVLDSADWLEALIHQQVCRDYNCRTIQQAAGGYGRGYDASLRYWGDVIQRLTALRDRRKMAVILLAHHQVKPVGDPEYPEYQQYQPRLQDKAMHRLSEWVDAVMFATRKMRVDENGNAQAIGGEGGERVLRCVGSPTCIAKSRYALPAELPLDWTAFMSAYTACIKAAKMNVNTPAEVPAELQAKN